MSDKLSVQGVPLVSLLRMLEVSKSQAIVEFRAVMVNTMRFKTFQKSDDIASGLAFVWSEKNKWDKISEELRLPVKTVKRKLNGICTRRDVIVHNADYNEATGDLNPCIHSDAKEVITYVSKVVAAIDSLVP